MTKNNDEIREIAGGFDVFWHTQPSDLKQDHDRMNFLYIFVKIVDISIIAASHDSNTGLWSRMAKMPMPIWSYGISVIMFEGYINSRKLISCGYNKNRRNYRQCHVVWNSNEKITGENYE